MLLAKGPHGLKFGDNRQGNRIRGARHRHVAHRSFFRMRHGDAHRARLHARTAPHLLAHVHPLHRHPLLAKKHRPRPPVDTDRGGSESVSLIHTHLPTHTHIHRPRFLHSLVHTHPNPPTCSQLPTRTSTSLGFRIRSMHPIICRSSPRASFCFVFLFSKLLAVTFIFLHVHTCILDTLFLRWRG